MIGELKERATILLEETYNAVHLPEDRYTDMRYPNILPLMRFHVDQYDVKGFGHIMMMHTVTKMGMELITMSLMPCKCLSLPYLLIDAMSMKKKRCVFVEYYGCGERGFEDRDLKEVYDRYKDLPGYKEKENWYIRERMPYSLIKTGEVKDLNDMAADSITAYLKASSDAKPIPGYEDKLKEFRERMIVQGNPSSTTLNMLLKKDGSRLFMENVIMPLIGKEER